MTADKVLTKASHSNYNLQILRPCVEHLEFRTESPLTPSQTKIVAKTVGSFLDLVGTAMGRGSFYNSSDQVRESEKQLHELLFNIDRGLYGLILTLPGATDSSRQLGIRSLLAGKRDSEGSALLSAEEESRVITKLLSTLKATRKLKLFVQIKEQKINNGRTRRLMLRSIMNEKKLELWSVRYRKKLRQILTHVFGQRMTGIVCTILKKARDQRTEKDQRILTKQFLRYSGKRNKANVSQCVAFILGLEEQLTLPLLKAYVKAKTTLSAGRKLPYETLEGLRSCYHKAVSNKTVLELTARNLTSGQRMVLQRKAEKAKVKVDWNPAHYDAVKLYLYAFERGLSEAINEALDKRAVELAGGLNLPYSKIAILLDASASMYGAESQALRPMAVALALRDGLVKTASVAVEIVCGGQPVVGARLIKPEGATSLAEGLVEALKAGPEAVFILSDGYENSPAGRTHDVVKAIRGMGIETPIFQFSPVFAAEQFGLRELAPELIGTLPVSRPEALGLTMFKAMLSVDSLNALQLFVNQALKSIGVEEKLPYELTTVAVKRGEVP
jgi:hypothetical protein